jgi:hypothetical protein
MNTNKQLTKGDKMRKIAMIVSILAVLGTSANAASWNCRADAFGGGTTCTYNPY